jgi:hypothetical protein
MLTITPEALAYITTKNQPIFLDIPPLIGCCIHLQECPTVRFGQPYDKVHYDETNIQGITVFVPHDLPNIPLSIALTSFLGFKKIVIKGWRLA